MDDIQRKLDLIDRQLAAGPGYYHRQIISTAPLLFCATGLIGGIVIQNAVSLPVRVWLVMLGFCATAAVLIFAVYKKDKSNSYAPMLLSACALICFLCLGAIRLAGFYQARPNDIRNLIADEEKLATIRGLIITEPYIQDNNDWKFARFQLTDPASSFYLKVGEVETVNGWAKVSGTVRVTVRVQVDGKVLDLKTDDYMTDANVDGSRDERVLGLKAGDYVQMYCWLDKFKPPTNPGQFNTAKYLARKNIFVAASVPSRDAIELLKDSSTGTGTFIKIKRHLQKIAGQALRGDLDIKGQNYALLQALVLGYRTKIDSDTYRAFQKTGLLHFICLSGMNFAILIGIIWWLCKTAGLMKRARAVICLAAAGIFLLVVPPNSPAIRAGIMCLAFCSSFFFRRKSNPFNSLPLAAMVLLLIRPTYLFEADWQLSFSAVLGILLFAYPIENFINEKVTALLEHPVTGKPRLYFRIVSRRTSPVIAVFSISLSAWLASIGILFYHFYRIDYLSSVWTAIVSPLIGVISVIGYVKTVLALFLPSAAALLDIIIGPLVSLLIRVVKLFAGWNISNILIGKISPAVVILYYAFVLFIFFAYIRKPLVKKLICAAVALVIIVSLGAAKWHRTHRDNLVLTCLDVGHGQAILAQLPGRTNILFDAGSLQRADVGGRIIAPFLDYSGISKIDAIVISHKDIDHINGIPEIVEHCKVGAVYADEVFFDEAKKSGATKFLNDWLIEKDLKLKIKRLESGLNLDSPATIKMLWPSEQTLHEQLSDNDKSLVLLIQFADVKVLLCSDIERFAQAQLLATIPDLKAGIVVVPHHGSTRTSDAAFLEKLGPDILIVSCDRTQYERRPAAGRKNNTKLFYTARDGAITVHINKAGTIETTFVKQQ